MLRGPLSSLESYLGPTERLLWSGQPAGGIRFRTQDIFMIPFSLMWGGFAIAWEVGVIYGMSRSKADNFPNVFAIVFPLFGVPFVCIGLYMIFGRFLVDRKQRENTIYGVTNERIIIISGLFSRTVKSLSLRSLADISLSEKSNGSGTIALGPINAFASMFSGMSWWPGTIQANAPSLDLIPKSREVYDILRKAYADAK